MENTQLQRLASPTPQPRPYVYRSAAQDSALPHPLRRSTDVRAAALPLFAGDAPSAMLLEFRIAVASN